MKGNGGPSQPRVGEATRFKSTMVPSQHWGLMAGFSVVLLETARFSGIEAPWAPASLREEITGRGCGLGSFIPTGVGMVSLSLCTSKTATSHLGVRPEQGGWLEITRA